MNLNSFINQPCQVMKIEHGKQVPFGPVKPGGVEAMAFALESGLKLDRLGKDWCLEYVETRPDGAAEE